MISAIDRVRIAAHITANPRTVLRAYQGKGNEYSRRRVAEGAKALGLAPPPEPSTSSSGSSPSESPPTSKAA